MTELALEEERLKYRGKILEQKPFRHEDLWHYFGFLSRLHAHQWGDFFNPYLELYREDNYFYSLGYCDGDPESGLEDDLYDVYTLNLFRTKSDDELKKGTVKSCVILTNEDVESFTLEKKAEEGPQNYVLWRHVDPDILFSPSSGTRTILESGRIGVYDTKQNASGFGLGLARNLWDASEFTLKQRARYSNWAN